MAMGDKQWQANERANDARKASEARQQSNRDAAHNRTMANLYNSPSNYYGPNGQFSRQQSVSQANHEVHTNARVQTSTATAKKSGGFGTIVLIVVGIVVAVSANNHPNENTASSGSATHSAETAPSAPLFQDFSKINPTPKDSVILKGDATPSSSSEAKISPIQSDDTTPSANGIVPSEPASASSAQVTDFVRSWAAAQQSNNVIAIASYYGPIVSPYIYLPSVSKAFIIEQAEREQQRGVQNEIYRAEDVIVEGSTSNFQVRLVKIWSTVSNGQPPNRTPCLLTIQKKDGLLWIVGEQNY